MTTEVIQEEQQQLLNWISEKTFRNMSSLSTHHVQFRLCLHICFHQKITGGPLFAQVEDIRTVFHNLSKSLPRRVHEVVVNLTCVIQNLDYMRLFIMDICIRVGGYKSENCEYTIISMVILRHRYLKTLMQVGYKYVQMILLHCKYLLHQHVCSCVSEHYAK